MSRHSSTLGARSSTPKGNMKQRVFSPRLSPIVLFQAQYGTEDVEPIAQILEPKAGDCLAVELVDRNSRGLKPTEGVAAEMECHEEVAA